MKKILDTALVLSAFLFFSCNEAPKGTSDTTTTETETVTGGGQSAVKDDESAKDVVKIAVGSADHTTLVAALKQADLVNSLSNAGPFTVFAPVNDAFAKLPKGTVETLLKPENIKSLAGILTYHVVAGNLNAAAVLKAIKKGKGKATLTTVAGGTLVASLVDGKVILTDEKGGKSTITATDLKATNGVIHVIDSVVLPK